MKANVVHTELDEMSMRKPELIRPENFHAKLSLQQKLVIYESAYQLSMVRQNKAMGNNGFWERYPASFPCPYSVQRIGTTGDGGKPVCGFENIKKLSKCLVYSFGINNEVTFEKMILEETNCTIRMYDVVRVLPNPVALLEEFPGRITYSEQGIGTSPGSTLKALMTENEHFFIDILKIDIEGGEWNTLAGAVADFPDGIPIGQLQVEIHTGHFKPAESPKYTDWYNSLELAGLRPFYKEKNPTAPLICWEYAFLSVKFGMFKIEKSLIVL